MADTAEFQFMKTIVVKPHIATDNSQLDLRLNNIVYVLEQDDSGWWGGHKEGEDCTGWFPGSCVREMLDDDAPEPAAEPASSRPLSVVPEESGRKDNCVASVADHGLDLHDALNHGGSLVASPNRRVSSGTTPVAQDSAAYANLQAEYRTISAIAEDRTSEIQQLQNKLNESEKLRKSESSSLKREVEDLRHKCHSVETQKADMQKQVQELRSQMDARSADLRQADVKIKSLQEQLSQAQQEVHDGLAERNQMTSHYERRLQEKDAELQRSLEQQKTLIASQAVHSSSASQPAGHAGDDMRRRLFPSTSESRVDTAPLFGGTAATSGPSFSPESIKESAVNAQSLSSVNSSSSAPDAGYSHPSRQPRQAPAASSGSGSRPAPSNCPRPFGAGKPVMGRANSLTRPAFRPLPGTFSPGGAASPGLAKCLSTGDLPATPRIDQELPAMGSVKDKIGMFESVSARSSTPKRTSIPEAAGRPVGSSTTPTASRSLQKSPSWRDAPFAAPSSHRQAQAPFGNQLYLPLNTGDTVHTEDGLEDQVNFNMSPMRRNA